MYFVSKKARFFKYIMTGFFQRNVGFFSVITSNSNFCLLGCGDWGRIELGKKGKRKQYHLAFDIEVVGKNIKWRKGVEDENSGEKSRFKKKMGFGKNILRDLYYTPLQN